MSSLLEGKLKKIIAKSFKGKLLQGTIIRDTSSTVDSYGDPIPGATETYTFEGIRESFDARYLAQSGIPASDVKILVLLGSMKRNGAIVDVQPTQGDKVFIGSPPRWHQIRNVLEIDPAGASISLQGTEIDAP